MRPQLLLPTPRNLVPTNTYLLRKLAISINRAADYLEARIL